MSTYGWVGALRALCLFGVLAIACGRTQDSRPGADAGGASDEAAGAPSGGTGTSQAGGINSEGGAPTSEAGAPGSPNSCDPELKACGLRCVDARFDPQNCGDCGTVCDAGTLCSGGKCAVACLGGSTQCGSRCVDTDND